MTRSGVVQSVHAFGEDKALGLMFTVFMTALLVVSFGLLIYRLPLLRARHELDSWVSREAAFLANNWILLFSAIFVLFATMFPTLSEALTGERLTVGPPFFNKWMLPIGLALLLLTGIGPLLAWRKSTVDNLRHQFMWPTLAALVTGGAARRARRARLVVGHLLRDVGVRRHHAPAGVRPRRARAAAVFGVRPRDVGHRPRRAQPAPVRRLHRPPRHRPDGARLRGRRLQAGRAAPAQARAVGHGGRVHGAARRDRHHAGRPEADGHRAG